MKSHPVYGMVPSLVPMIDVDWDSWESPPNFLPDNTDEWVDRIQRNPCPKEQAKNDRRAHIKEVCDKKAIIAARASARAAKAAVIAARASVRADKAMALADAAKAALACAEDLLATIE